MTTPIPEGGSPSRPVRAWAARLEPVFITGMGRSGTVLLSRLVALDQRVQAHHETLAGDFAHLTPRPDENSAAWFRIERPGRMLRVFARRRLSKPRQRRWIEVNSALRYSTGDLAVAFPRARFLHLVRDPERVITSLWHRRHFTPAGDNHHNLRPAGRDETVWDATSRFEKLCWLWADAVSHLTEREVPMVRLEDVVADYDSCGHHLLAPLDLTIGRDAWSGVVTQTANPSAAGQPNGPVPWDQDAFDAICGPLRAELGYG